MLTTGLIDHYLLSMHAINLQD